jgi:hypothetical protein
MHGTIDNTGLFDQLEAECKTKLAGLQCPNCGSKEMTWHCGPQNRGGVMDGRIKMNEIGVIFFLGCDSCSETLKVIDGDHVATVLTQLASGTKGALAAKLKTCRETLLTVAGKATVLGAPTTSMWEGSDMMHLVRKTLAETE